MEAKRYVLISFIGFNEFSRWNWSKMILEISADFSPTTTFTSDPHKVLIVSRRNHSMSESAFGEVIREVQRSVRQLE